MNVKAKALKRAMSVLSDVNMPDHAEIDIVVREENLDKDTLGDCVTLTASWTKKPATYDRNQKEINVVAVIEIFADYDNKHPRCSITESRELE